MSRPLVTLKKCVKSAIDTTSCSSSMKSRQDSAEPANSSPKSTEGIESDLTLVGKALSGGFYPISAVLSNKETLSIFQPGDHGSTFGGNPLACAVAREALKVIEDENLI